MAQLFLKPGGLLARLVMLGCFALSAGCESLLFYPSKTLVRTPADIHLRYEDRYLSAVGGPRLHSWWLPAKGTPRASLLFVHGNAQNISHHIASVYWLPEQGVNVLLLDYRGYGKSAGEPTVAGAIDDVQAALAYMADSGAEHPLYVLGQSLGASLAGQALARDDALRQRYAGVVLDSGFSRYAQIAADTAASHPLTWLLQKPASWAMPKGYDLVDALPQLGALPVMLIHGRRDRVVSMAHFDALHAAANPEATQVYLHDGEHIAGFAHPTGRQVLLGFIAEGACAGASACPFPALIE